MKLYRRFFTLLSFPTYLDDFPGRCLDVPHRSPPNLRGPERKSAQLSPPGHVRRLSVLSPQALRLAHKSWSNVWTLVSYQRVTCEFDVLFFPRDPITLFLCSLLFRCFQILGTKNDKSNDIHWSRTDKCDSHTLLLLLTPHRMSTGSCRST